jgi:hypothetical protein
VNTLYLQQRAALYNLKRRFGGPIDVYKLLTCSSDPRTGKIALTTKVVHVRRAAILPTSESRKALARKMAAGTEASRDFTASGAYEVGVCQFIIDRKDTRELDTLTMDDWIVAHGQKYRVSKVDCLEVDASWIVTGRELVGEVPQQEFDVRSQDAVTLTETA